MKKYPSIEQFRNVIRELKMNHDYQGKDANDGPIYNHISDYPVILFRGTVKLHGSNAGIVRYKDGLTQFQSREQVLGVGNDNAGFYQTHVNKNLDFLFEDIEFNDYIAIYGEWCGKGIQSGVAISQLPKMLVIFGCKVDDVWVDFKKSDPTQQIYNINDFPTFEVEVDFNHPEIAQNEFVKLTEQVESECPVGKEFGVSGIGEGIVWKAMHNDKYYSFKTKGEKHSNSKVKTIAAVDIEEVNSINEFVDFALTENRLKQGLDKLTEMGLPVDQTSTGAYLKWIVGDVLKEEGDTMVKNGLNEKKVCSALSTKARVWFFQNF